MRAKIVHVITGLLTGGAEAMLHKLIQRMDQDRFAHTVVSLADGASLMSSRLERLGVPVYSGGLRGGLPSPIQVAKVLRLVRSLHADLLHGWMYHGNLAALAAALPSVPVVWSICATQFALREQKFSTAAAIWLGARLSRWPDRIISDSMASAQVHRDRLRFSGARWEVIPNGFDLDQFRPCERARADVRSEFSIPPDALLIGLIGRYHPVKDHTCFLQAAALLRKRRPEARFLVVGPEVGDNAFLRERAAALGLRGAVRLVDERPDIPRITAALDIAISSSYSESFPNVVGEAMSCGVPCVVTDVGDSALLVGDTGLVVPARDPHALADSCNELAARGRQGRQALGRLARQRIAERFSIHAVAPHYEKIYEQTLAPRRPVRAVDQSRLRAE